MDRRNFLKLASGLLAFIPFLSWRTEEQNNKTFVVDGQELLMEIDKASQDDDYTGILLFNDVLPEEWEVTKEYYIKNTMLTKHTYASLDYECDFEWIRLNDRI